MSPAPQMAAEPVVPVRGLVVRVYDPHPVQDLPFSIGRGARIARAGASGPGQSLSGLSLLGPLPAARAPRAQAGSGALSRATPGWPAGGRHYPRPARQQGAPW